jgi:D-alanyl-D-alanine carboxypeptidase
MTTAMNKPLRPLWFLFAAISAALWLFSGTVSVANSGDTCAAGLSQPAAANALSLQTMAVNMFGRAEPGWTFYAPLIGSEIGTTCPPTSPGFSRVLTQWQSMHRLPATGLVDAATLGTLKQVWQQRRPFVTASRNGCPDPPQDSALAEAAPSESYGGKAIQLRVDALAAYRQMIQAARQAGVIPPASNLATIFSGYRSPSYDAARCATQHNCQGITRASCSAHRTGNAMDIYLGAAPSFSPDSSADANRLYISQTPLYRWLVRNAAQFHLVNYPFEPWHWEFAG